MKPLFKSVEKTRKEAVETALIAAAERVLDKKGYDSTTMRDIAKEAGCSNGSLYLYFKTKEELITSLVNTHMCHLLSLMTERMKSGNDPVEKLRLGCETLLGYFSQHQGFFRIFFSGRSGRAGFDLGLVGAGREALDDFTKFQVSLMEQAQNEGRVRSDIPAIELTLFLQDVAIAAMARWTRSGETKAINQNFSSLWLFTCRGLGLSN